MRRSLKQDIRVIESILKCIEKRRYGRWIAGIRKKKKRRNWQRARARALIVTGSGPREVPLFISLHTRYPRPWEKLQAERPMSNDQCRWLSNRLAVPIDPSKRASLLIAAAKNKFANISVMKTKRNESQYTLNARHFRSLCPELKLSVLWKRQKMFNKIRFSMFRTYIV